MDLSLIWPPLISLMDTAGAAAAATSARTITMSIGVERGSSLRISLSFGRADVPSGNGPALAATESASGATQVTGAMTPTSPYQRRRRRIGSPIETPAYTAAFP